MALGIVLLRMAESMSKAIFRHFCIVLFVSLGIFSTILVFALSERTIENTKKDALYSIAAIDYFLQDSRDVSKDIFELNHILDELTDTRLTIFDSLGNVITDSEYMIDENHFEREEVQEALKNGTGEAIRYSDTSKQKHLYVAYYSNEYVIRVAMPYIDVFTTIKSLQIPLFFSIVVSLIIAALVAKEVAEHLARPALEISKEVQNLNHNTSMQFKKYEYNEYNIVTKALLTQEKVIKETMHQLEFEKLKIDNILDQMKEGFILIDNDFFILLVNQKAKQLLNMGMKNHTSIKEYVFDERIMVAIENVEREEKVDFEQNERVYNCFINKMEFGITLLFVDVTQSKEVATMRQEFFSNVSHELKTPMTAIKGYSELLEEDIIKDQETKKEVFRKIQKEVLNMASLVNDILMISRLESKEVEVRKHSLSLVNIVEEVLEPLQNLAKEKHITIEKQIEDVYYLADKQHIYQLISNLVSNAIKYNKENGAIFIKVYSRNYFLHIDVEDSGIGISNVEKDRVFERFYRCDKARNKKIGGTGLGLSIVKHVVQYYGGSISLDSELHVGTIISVILPIE